MRDVTDYSFDGGRETDSRPGRKPNLPPHPPVKPPTVDGDIAPAAPQSVGTAQPLAHDFALAVAESATPTSTASPRITLRLTPDEDALLRERASNQSISAYVREESPDYQHSVGH